MRSGVRRLAEEPEGDGGRPAGPTRGLGFTMNPQGGGSARQRQLWVETSHRADVKGGRRSRPSGRTGRPVSLSHASPALVALGFLNHRASVGHPRMRETLGVGAGRPGALPCEVLWNLPRGRPPRGHGTLRRTLPTLILQGDAGWTPAWGSAGAKRPGAQNPCPLRAPAAARPESDPGGPFSHATGHVTASFSLTVKKKKKKNLWRLQTTEQDRKCSRRK